MNYGLFALIGACTALGCSAQAERYEPASSAEPGSVTSRAGKPPASRDTSHDVDSLLARGAGVLVVSARGKLTSFLGATHLIVEDANGQVVAGADEEVADPEAAHDSELSLTVPADAPYTLRLSATTADSQATTCHATVTPVHVLAGATARVDVLAWQCGDKAGYVPAAVQNDCYWLADWTFVERTSAAVGEPIGVKVAAHGTTEAGASYEWSSSAPELGPFENPRAAETAVACRAAGEALTLEVLISDAGCEQRVSQAVSCGR